MKLLIKNGYVIDKKSGLDGVCHILIEDGKISELTDSMDSFDGLSDIYQIDAVGNVVAAGLVDMHCHLRDPGYEKKETIESGSRAAACGGFTSIVCMPDTSPVADNKSVVEYIISKARSASLVNVYPVGAISKGLEGKQLASIGEMKFAGIVAVSDDSKSVMDSELMRNAMIYANNFEIPIISNCEDVNLTGNGMVNMGAVSTVLGLAGIPLAAEAVMVARELVLSDTTGIPIHLTHISTEESVELIRRAKGKGTAVTCDTAPQYFSLTEEAVLGYNADAKLNPPLRTERDVDAVIKGLVDGTIDAIATDHAPQAFENKRHEFQKAQFGMVGFETALSLGITKLVKPGHLSLQELLAKMSVVPSDILQLGKGSLEAGADADIVIFDQNECRTVNAAELHSKSKNTPFDGAQLYGAVKHTIVGGKLVYSNGDFNV